MIVSFIAISVVAATDHTAGDYPSYGSGLNWLLGLLCWLLGCVLAEFARTVPLRHVTTVAIWAWRASIFVAAWVCSVLRFHSPIGYPWTLNLFAVLVALWLYREIQFRHTVAPSRILEWAGLWSYSRYLIHLTAGVLFASLFPSIPAGAIRWAFMVCFVLTSCYAFYLVSSAPAISSPEKPQRLRPLQHVAIETNAA